MIIEIQQSGKDKSKDRQTFEKFFIIHHPLEAEISERKVKIDKLNKK